MPEAPLRSQPGSPAAGGRAARRETSAYPRVPAWIPSRRAARSAAPRPHVVMVDELRRRGERAPLVAYAWVLVVGLGLLLGLMLGQHLVPPW